jgi:hypothetical protein
VKIGSSHRARKELFQRGIRQGYLTLADIERALPSGTISQGERWLLLYSLRAAGVDVRDDGAGARVDVPAPPDQA